MILQIYDRSCEDTNVILEEAKTLVAALTKQPANNLSLMIVVYVSEELTLLIHALDVVATNAATAVLLVKHLLEVLWCNAILPKQHLLARVRIS